MSYNSTFAEDIARAKALLDRGRPETDVRSPTYGMVSGGTIFGADIYVAYKLLESFVAELERLRLVTDALPVYGVRFNGGRPDIFPLDTLGEVEPIAKIEGLYVRVDELREALKAIK